MSMVHSHGHDGMVSYPPWYIAMVMMGLEEIRCIFDDNSKVVFVKSS